MSEPRQCCFCQRFGTPPDLLPYLGEGRSHYWAHSLCDQQVREARRAKEKHESGDGV